MPLRGRSCRANRLNHRKAAVPYPPALDDIELEAELPVFVTCEVMVALKQPREFNPLRRDWISYRRLRYTMNLSYVKYNV